MIAFSFRGINVYRYGIFYFLAFVIGYFRCIQLARKKVFARHFPRVQRIFTHEVDDILLLIFAGVLVGGRLGHVIIYNLPYYLHNPQNIFAFWQGGMSFIGGLLGVVIAILAFRKVKKGKWHDLLILCDSIVVMLPLGIILGRFGNFLNQELYGIAISPHTAPTLFYLLSGIHMLYIYPAIDHAIRVNSNLLSIIFEGAVSFIIVIALFIKQLRKKVFYPGKISATFLGRYSLVRFFLEYVRADAQREFIGAFTISQWFFIIFFFVALIRLSNIEEAHLQEE